MHDAWRLYREQGAPALWERTLGFFDWDLERTMAHQRSALERQLTLLNASPLGRQIFDGAAPRTLDEFRAQAPLTTYDDYLDTLGKQREDVLPSPAEVWTRTSGRSRNQPKWVPLSPQALEYGAWLWLGVVLMSAADRPGAVRIGEGVRLLNMAAPPPYAGGSVVPRVQRVWPFEFYPPDTPASLALPFEERMGLAFRSATNNGVDIAMGLAAAMCGIGETFHDMRPPGSLASRLKRPKAFGRMGRAALRAKLANRRVYPRDVWAVRGIISGGMDSSLFRERVRDYWGTYPLEVLVSTEGNLIAMQSWDHTTMTLIPTLNFFEFIPDDELTRESEQPGYRPGTVLLDGLETDHNYELVLTSLLGGPLVRYRTGDVLRVTGLSNPRTGTALPQVLHYTRRTDLLEVGGFVTLTEQTVWRAIEEARVPYEEWSIRKETDGSEPMLHLRIEPKADSGLPADEARAAIDRELAALDSNWSDMREIAQLSPLRVTYLPPGSFQRYRDRKVAEGADLGHLKPQHMNATDEVIAMLLEEAARIQPDPA